MLLYLIDNYLCGPYHTLPYPVLSYREIYSYCGYKFHVVLVTKHSSALASADTY